MVTLTIRNLPDGVRNELAARAALSGRSMQEFVLGVLTELTRHKSQDQVLAEIRARARDLPPLDADAVRGDLAADRR
jgi:plasmid stability protein